jgi:hypothetical protein
VGSIFFKEARINGRRGKHEDEEGDRRREEELEKIRKIRYLPGILVKSSEYDVRIGKFNRLAKSMALEQIEAEDRAEHAAWKERHKRWENEPPVKGIFSRLTKEEMEAKHRDWDASGLSKERQAELVRIFGLPNVRPFSTGKSDGSEVVSQPRASSPPPPKHTSRKTRGGRITKNTAQNQKAIRPGTRSRQSAPTSAKSPTPGRRPTRSKRVPEVLDESGVSTARARHGSRRSRRLAGQSPEFGMLSGSRLSKKAMVAKGSKPRGISKSGREGTNRPKRSKKQSEG